MAAYIKLSQSKGSNTPSFDKSTIDGISLKKLCELRDRVISGQYAIGITKRVFIPKSNGKQRPLGIPPFDDRLVQEVIRTILQIIYEPIFSNHSHGFRPGRSCHTALRHVRKGSAGFSWAIEGDIKGFFDNIDHTILIELLNKKIKDPRFISLIYSFLRAKIKEEGKGTHVSYIGSPQGSIISPILSNILLHEFDVFMENFILQFNKGKYRRANPEYSRLYHKYGAKIARRVSQSDRLDPNFRRMHYVRYAEDFLITIIGTKSEAIEIKRKCSEFLSGLKLTLNDEKTLITSPKDRSIPFLGYLIQKTAPRVASYRRAYAGRIRKVLRTTPETIYLKADSAKVKKRLYEKGFCRKDGYPIPNFKYLSNTQQGVNIQMGYILRGLANYYQLANNSRQMVSR
jgi:group II intron reverse transcriptase/maturase